MTIPNRLIAGALAAFIVVVVAQDVLRDDLSAVKHQVSHLSLGPYGWVNILALTTAGLAVLALGWSVRQQTDRRWPVRWLTVVGVGLVIAGLFVSDAPPGTRYVDTVTWHGPLHDVGGGLTFIGLIATCLVTRCLVSARWGLIAALTVAVSWVAASAMTAVAYADPSAFQLSGIAERFALFTGIIWLIVLALNSHRLRVHGKS